MRILYPAAHTGFSSLTPRNHPDPSILLPVDEPPQAYDKNPFSLDVLFMVLALTTLVLTAMYCFLAPITRARRRRRATVGAENALRNLEQIPTPLSTPISAFRAALDRLGSWRWTNRPCECAECDDCVRQGLPVYEKNTGLPGYTSGKDVDLPNYDQTMSNEDVEMRPIGASPYGQEEKNQGAQKDKTGASEASGSRTPVIARPERAARAQRPERTRA